MAGLKKMLNPLPWQWYRDFFALSYLRYMATWFAIVPAVASIFALVPRQVRLPFTDPKIQLTLSLPFTWQVLWLGSLFFLGAFVVYQIRVPVFVRRYHSLDSYLAKGHSPRWISWECKLLFDLNTGRDKFVERLLKKGYLLPTELQDATQGGAVEVNTKTTDFHFQHGGNGYVLAMPILRTDLSEDEAATGVAVREIFWEVLARYAESRSFARLTILLFLYLAGGSVVFVTCQHIWSAVTYFM
ncbi:MAG: hypothetical protein Q8M47_07085 [Devosia sp.]|nr:hypothetical protein [Devosia sp.]